MRNEKKKELNAWEKETKMKWEKGRKWKWNGKRDVGEKLLHK